MNNYTDTLERVIANEDEARNNIYEMIKSFEINKEESGISIYARYDKYDHTVSIDDYRGLTQDDDYIFNIYNYTGCYDEPLDEFTTIQEISDVLGITEDELKQETVKYFSQKHNENFNVSIVKLSDVKDYIINTSELEKKIDKYYFDNLCYYGWIDDEVEECMFKLKQKLEHRIESGIYD